MYSPHQWYTNLVRPGLPHEGTLNREAELSLPPLRVPCSLVLGGQHHSRWGQAHGIKKELAHQGYRVSDCKSVRRATDN